MTADSRPERRRARLRRALIFLLGAAAWTLISCYPDPGVLFRNLGRYQRLPVDPKLEQKMEWQLPDEPGSIEHFVDSLLVPTSDWQLYRVPWYVPLPEEAVRVLHGDCEAKTLVLASLLAGKGLPYEIRASFSHIWVDYPGRRAQAGETEDIAYLEGREGRLGLRWPTRVEWRRALAAQREQLWEAMPPARKALWLVGLLWVGLATALLGGPAPAGEVASQWRPRRLVFLRRTVWLSVMVLAVIVVAPGVWRSGPPARWTLTDLREVLVLSLAAGAFLAWLRSLRGRTAVSLSDDGDGLMVRASLGCWQRARALEVADIAHIELESSPGGERPWTVFASLRTGERVTLARYEHEVAARKALLQVGLAVKRHIVVRAEGYEERTLAEEIGLSLRARALRRPRAEARPKPATCDLHVESGDGLWAMAYPPPKGHDSLVLLAIALFPAGLLLLATWMAMRFTGSLLIWLGWILAASLLSLTVYLALVLRGEIVARLARVRVEIGGGELRFHNPAGGVESLPLAGISSVELSRLGETLTLSVVSPERVVHLRDLCPPEHREWVRSTIEHAILQAGE